MESQAHIDLVNRVLEYSKLIIPQDNYNLIQVDSDGANSNFRTNNNFVPDVFYKFDDLLVIGEAKTYDDFERKHSKEQYDDYIDECRYYSGTAKLVIGVPWQLVMTAKNYFKRIKKRENLDFEIIIVNEIGKDFKV